MSLLAVINWFSLAIIDHNECTNGVAKCNHNCQNTAGGYYCWCNTGYELDIDDETCVGNNINNNINIIVNHFDSLLCYMYTIIVVVVAS